MTQSPAAVVVIGAGFAGLSAAVKLANAGVQVTVVEAAPRLGGRATAFTDRETGERVDNGQHVLFGCYRETYAFLRSLGTAGLAPTQERLRLAMAGPDGRLQTLRCPSWPAPWHLVGGLLRWPALGWSDRLSALRLGRVLMGARRRGAAAVAAGVPAADTVAAWLARHRQSQVLCDWLWHPLAIAALNQSPDEAAAVPFVRVLGELFGPHRDDSAVGLPAVPLDDLYATPAQRVVESRGGAVLTKSPARVVFDERGRIAGVEAGETTIPAPIVVSSVPWHALGRLWERTAPSSLGDTISAATRTGSSPIVTVNLWFDGPVTDEPFVGLVHGPMHWVFNKSALYGNQTSHLSVVASGAVELAERENHEITRAAVEQIQTSLPVSRSRRLMRSVVVREHRATFSLAPGAPKRPGPVTPLPGFFLAGDWTDTGLPGTIEGAVVSGHRAADAVLRRLSQDQER